MKSGKARRRLEKSARHLFDLVDRFRGHEAVAHMHAYKLMARLLQEQCEVAEGEASPVALKKPADVSAESLQNPSDPDATYGHKGKGYKASLTETCVKENDFQVITDVAVAGANQPDAKDVAPVLDRLKEAGATPDELFADAGYGSGGNILHAAGRGVDLVAPLTSGSTPDEARVRADDFVFDAGCATVLACFEDKAPLQSGLTPNGKDILAIFPESACEPCPFKPQCPVKRHKNGTFRFRLPRKAAAAASRRNEQKTETFKERYKIRSGIEATISETNRLTGLKRSWTRGKARVTASTFFKALAINVKRYVQTEAEKAMKRAKQATNPSKTASKRPLNPVWPPNSPAWALAA